MALGALRATLEWLWEQGAPRGAPIIPAIRALLDAKDETIGECRCRADRWEKAALDEQKAHEITAQQLVEARASVAALLETIESYL
jgi:hypothetical protein